MPSVTERLDEARRPEDLFGCLLGNASERRALLDRTYQILLEKSPEEKRRLDDAYRAARDALVRGSYGRILVSVSLRQLHGEKGDYALIQRLEADESIEQWLARSASGDELLLRRALDDQGQALLRQEARALHRLNGQGAVEGRLRAYVPTLLDSFPSASNSHLVNVFTPLDGLVSLAEVRVAYPDGVPARDAIWMLRRLLIAVGFGHVNGLVNASVLPENVLIHPQEHGLVLADWGHSYERGKRQVSFSGEPEWRPTEIAASQCPLPATDIYLAARCFQYLLGATLEPGAFPPACQMS